MGVFREMKWDGEDLELRLVIRDGRAFAYLPDVPGQHFPVTIEDDVLERIKTLSEETMQCPECGGTGSDGWSFCRTCNGTGEINRHHNQVPDRIHKRTGRLIQYLPGRKGHNDDTRRG